MIQNPCKIFLNNLLVLTLFVRLSLNLGRVVVTRPVGERVYRFIRLNCCRSKLKAAFSTFN